MKKATDLKIKLLGIIPHFESPKANLSPQEVAAFSGLLTFKGDSVEALVKEARAKKQDIEKKIQFILRKSALRGHASMATMPVFCFSFEGSKMIGSMLTGIMFSSALMHSGRRAAVTAKDNVYPSGILKNKKAQAIYEEASQLNIETFNQLLAMDVIKDEAGKILHYGTYGTGVITLPVESLVTFLHEWELEKEWMPEEGEVLIRQLERQMKKLGVDLLYATRSVAPKNTYPFPNLFKDPARSNLVRDLKRAGYLKKKETEVVSVESILGKEFQKRVEALKKKRKQIFASPARLKKDWPELLHERRRLIRDYGTGLQIKVASEVSWRVWRDRKRHRTAPVVTESIYHCLKEADGVFRKHEKAFERQGDLGEKAVLEIDRVLAVPPLLRKKEEARKLYLKSAFTAMKAYRDLLRAGIKEREAVFVIPRAIRIGMLQEYNLHNLIEGYYPLRSCVTADEQIFRLTREEIGELKKKLKQKDLGVLNDLLEPKCLGAGFCPEEETCGYVKRFVKGYDNKLHEQMKDDLEKRFQAALKRLR